jgi:anaerobic selenocysteine-containing dehydrogenase
MDRSKNEFALVPTFRIPTLIHTRSNNAKWLYELSNNNPVWIGPEDAKRVGIKIGDLLRITTASGYFVNRAWVTEGIRPGVVACSHHMGRWRTKGGVGADRMAAAPVDIKGEGGKWMIRRIGDIEPYESNDPDTMRIWWHEGGVHQNLTFSSQPDPISGMHCWHHKVTVTKAEPDDRYGDVFVDTNKSYAVFQEWMKSSTSPRSSKDSTLRRPLWFARAVKPAKSAYYRTEEK